MILGSGHEPDNDLYRAMVVLLVCLIETLPAGAASIVATVPFIVPVMITMKKRNSTSHSRRAARLTRSSAKAVAPQTGSSSAKAVHTVNVPKTMVSDPAENARNSHADHYNSYTARMPRNGRMRRKMLSASRKPVSIIGLKKWKIRTDASIVTASFRRAQKAVASAAPL